MYRKQGRKGHRLGLQTKRQAPVPTDTHSQLALVRGWTLTADRQRPSSAPMPSPFQPHCLYLYSLYIEVSWETHTCDIKRSMPIVHFLSSQITVLLFGHPLMHLFLQYTVNFRTVLYCIFFFFSFFFNLY